MFRKTTAPLAALAAAFIAFQPMAGASAEALIINPGLLTVEPKIKPEVLVKPPVLEPAYTVIPTEPLLPKPISCSAAKQLVKNAGYKKVKTIECNGVLYAFKAKKNGQKMVVTVHAFTKQISIV